MPSALSVTSGVCSFGRDGESVAEHFRACGRSLVGGFEGGGGVRAVAEEVGVGVAGRDHQEVEPVGGVVAEIVHSCWIQGIKVLTKGSEDSSEGGGESAPEKVGKVCDEVLNLEALDGGLEVSPGALDLDLSGSLLFGS